MFQYMTAAAAAAPMQGTYIPQYTPVPPTAVPVEVRPTNKHTVLAKIHKSVPVYSQRKASLLIHLKLAHHIKKNLKPLSNDRLFFEACKKYSFVPSK